MCNERFKEPQKAWMFHLKHAALTPIANNRPHIAHHRPGRLKATFILKVAFKIMVRQGGFEPPAVGLEGRFFGLAETMRIQKKHSISKY